jgi:hypothetical protein
MMNIGTSIDSGRELQEKSGKGKVKKRGQRDNREGCEGRAEGGQNDETTE